MSYDVSLDIDTGRGYRVTAWRATVPYTLGPAIREALQSTRYDPEATQNGLYGLDGHMGVWVSDALKDAADNLADGTVSGNGATRDAERFLRELSAQCRIHPNCSVEVL